MSLNRYAEISFDLVDNPDVYVRRASRRRPDKFIRRSYQMAAMSTASYLRLMHLLDSDVGVTKCDYSFDHKARVMDCSIRWVYKSAVYQG